MNERSFLFYVNREFCQEEKDPNCEFRLAEILALPAASRFQSRFGRGEGDDVHSSIMAQKI